MPIIQPITCVDCKRAPAVGRGTRCEACARKNQQTYDRYRNRKDASKFEQTTEWKKCSQHLRRCNPQCQRIHYGVRCMNPSVLVHHLIAPDDAPSLRTCPSNLVALCASCHPYGPGDNNAGTYAPTLSHIAGVTHTYEHNQPATPAAPGTVAEALASLRR